MRGVWFLVVLAAAALALFGVRSYRARGIPAKDLKRHSVVGLSMEFPAEPKPKVWEVPPAVRGKIKSVDAVQVNLNRFDALASRVLYGPETPLTLETAFDAMIQNQRHKESILEIKSARVPAAVSGLNGYRYSTTLLKNGDELEHQGLFLFKDGTYFDVHILFPKASSESRATAARMIESIQVLP